MTESSVMEDSPTDVATRQSPVDSSLTVVAKTTNAGLGMALVGGVLGGVIGFLVLNATHPFFPFEELPELGMTPSAELVKQYHQAEYTFRSSNGAVDCGILGGCLGLLMGIFAVQRRALGAIVTGVVGLAFGAIAGFVIGRLVGNALINSVPQTLAQSAFYHGTVWGSIGVGVGACVALLNRSSAFLNTSIFGLVGGVLGAIVFNIVAPIVAPAANLSILTPETAAERGVWIGSAAVCIGLFVGLALRDLQKQRLQKTAEA